MVVVVELLVKAAAAAAVELLVKAAAAESPDG